MNYAQKILLIVGTVFTAMGSIFTIMFLGMRSIFSDNLTPFLLLPLLFVVLGLSFIIGVAATIRRQALIRKKGTRYAAKIYGYVENTSYRINRRFPLNTKVHYFDGNHIEREAIIPTNFSQGASLYPLGMTIDIFEYQGKFSFDPASLRNEILPGEQELMDNKPVDPSSLHLTAVACPNCGASYEAAAGYVSHCPYCGSYQNL